MIHRFETWRVRITYYNLQLYICHSNNIICCVFIFDSFYYPPAIKASNWTKVHFVSHSNLIEHFQGCLFKKAYGKCHPRSFLEMKVLVSIEKLTKTCRVIVFSKKWRVSDVLLLAHKAWMRNTTLDNSNPICLGEQ